MDKNRDTITATQVAFIVASSILGIAMLAIPRFIVDNAGIGAPMACFLGIMVGAVAILVITLLGRRFPRHTVIGYSEMIVGKPIGRIFSVIIILFFALLLGIETRQFTEIVSTALLPNTPMQIGIGLMLLLCTSTGFQSVATFAYIHFFYLPLIIIPILIVLLPGLKDVEFYHLTPILGNNPTFQGFFYGGMVSLQAILSFFVIAMVIPYMKEPKKSVKSGLWGYFIGCCIYLFIVTMSVGVFGEVDILSSFWPTLVMGRMANVPADVLSRIDAILLTSWIYGVFTTLFSNYFIVVRGIGELFKFYNYRLISFVGFPFLFFIAMYPDNIYDMYNNILQLTFYGVFIVVLYPIILFLVAVLRKKAGASA